MRSIALSILILTLVPFRAVACEYPIEFKCRGLENYEIRGTHNVDWAWGAIRAKDGSVSIGFAVGLMVVEAVPAKRPAGFRSFKVERIGNVVLRYGLNVREKQMQATLIGAPMNPHVSLVAQVRHAEELLTLARMLARAKCSVRIERR